jgi:transposase-like protein
MLDLFEAPKSAGYTEDETAQLLGVTAQTLRNWRVGYRNKSGEYAPRLVKGREWYKLRESKRAPVLYDPTWVAKMVEIKKLKEAM